ncbi:MAG: hypothetical protein KAR21_23090, partial [Spirochaetales bacterium]|nr:hypothetical protein [Spirochaetales bacterium]
INRFATRIVADALTGSGGGSVFTSDDDPEFIADALPFTLKVFESLLYSDPENIDLIEATAGGFISYANGFLQSPAELLEYEKIEEKDQLFKRAAAMYRRGGDYASQGLELLYPGFDTLFSEGDWQSALVNMRDDAVPFLYWKAAAILGEFSVDSFNPGLMVEVPGAVALAVRALELKEDYDQGALHDLLIAVFGNLPVSLVYRTIDEESNYSVIRALSTYYAAYGLSFKEMSFDDQAMFHLNSSLKLSVGMKASTYVLASSIYINNQDSDGFILILQKALEIDTNHNPENRLMNIISQRKARWLIDHIEDYFFML